MHFFSPANVMPLLENVRGAKSSARTIATAMAVGSAIGKWPVLVRFRPRPPSGPEVSGFRKFPDSGSFRILVHVGVLLAVRDRNSRRICPCVRPQTNERPIAIAYGWG
jgi:hypothetical protein